MNRESTNSITHLVKIVAEEVVMDVLEREGFTNKPWDQLYSNQILQTIRDTAKDHLESVSYNVERAGYSWDSEEREIFRQEITTAIAQIAKNHKRTMGAVRAALKRAINEGEITL